MAAKKRKNKGWTLFWVASKRVWVLKYKSALDGWVPKNLPKDISRRERGRAEAWAIEWMGNAEALKLRPRAKSNGLILRDASEAWKRLRSAPEAKTSPATVRRFAGDFRNILAPFVDGRAERSIGDEDVVALSTDYALIRRWFRALVGRLSAWRARSAFSTLRSFFDDAIVEKWIRGPNPMGNEALVRELPDQPNKADRGGVVLFEYPVLQELVLHRHVPLGRAARYVVAGTLGNREGEIAGLTWGALHLDAPIPHVDIVRARRLIRADDEVLGPLKTGTSRGVLPLHTAAVAALREWRDDLDNGVALLLGHEPLPSDPVFPSERPQDRGGFSRPRAAEKLRDDLVAAELAATDAKGRNLTMHACRKTFGTFLKRAGVPESIRKALMRHGANDVTEDFYTENLPAMAAAVALIPLVWALVPRLVPSLVPGGTKRPAKGRILLEPRVGLEPTTCALRKHDADIAAGAPPSSRAGKDRPRGTQSNAAKLSSGPPSTTGSASGTKDHQRGPGPARATTASGWVGARIEVDGKVVARVDGEAGDDLRIVQTRLHAASRGRR